MNPTVFDRGGRGRLTQRFEVGSTPTRAIPSPRRPPPLYFHWKPLCGYPRSDGTVKVLLVSLTRETGEIEALIRSAGHELADKFVQTRPHPDRRFFLGKGKLEELATRVESLDPDIVLFNGELHPSQHYHLEKRLGKECYDRLRLILELFAQRAHGREAKLQVEFALLQYEMPLLREWIHSAALGERPGFMGGGEYRVDTYFETVKRRMRRIREELELVRRERGQRRVARKDRCSHLVALAGYANAGKSSMLNALTGERVLVEERMFSTLSTTTRALQGARKRILLTDTVGFVDQVPLWMVEAFHSTFEEIYESDLILLLLDASDTESEFARKLNLAARTLLPRVQAAAVLTLLTKADLASAGELDLRARLLQQSEFRATPIFTSTVTARGLAELRDAIASHFTFPLDLTIRLPTNSESASNLGWLYRNTEVLHVDYGPQHTEVRVRCRSEDGERIERMGRVVARSPTVSP